VGCGEVLAEDPSALWAVAKEADDGSRSLVSDGLGGAGCDGTCADDPRDPQPSGELVHPA